METKYLAVMQGDGRNWYDASNFAPDALASAKDGVTDSRTSASTMDVFIEFR